MNKIRLTLARYLGFKHKKNISTLFSKSSCWLWSIELLNTGTQQNRAFLIYFVITLAHPLLQFNLSSYSSYRYFVIFLLPRQFLRLEWCLPAASHPAQCSLVCWSWAVLVHLCKQIPGEDSWEQGMGRRGQAMEMARDVDSLGQKAGGAKRRGTEAVDSQAQVRGPSIKQSQALTAITHALGEHFPSSVWSLTCQLPGTMSPSPVLERQGQWQNWEEKKLYKLLNQISSLPKTQDPSLVPLQEP